MKCAARDNDKDDEEERGKGNGELSVFHEGYMIPLVRFVPEGWISDRWMLTGRSDLSSRVIDIEIDDDAG